MNEWEFYNINDYYQMSRERQNSFEKRLIFFKTHSSSNSKFYFISNHVYTTTFVPVHLWSCEWLHDKTQILQFLYFSPLDWTSMDYDKLYKELDPTLKTKLPVPTEELVSYTILLEVLKLDKNDKKYIFSTETFYQYLLIMLNDVKNSSQVFSVLKCC